MKAKDNLRQAVATMIDIVQHANDINARVDAREKILALADAVAERDAARRDLKKVAGAAQVLVTLTKALTVVKQEGAIADSHSHVTKVLGQIKRRQA